MPTVTLPGGNNNEVKREIDRRLARTPRKKRARYGAAAYEIAPVESGWKDLPGGDADSYGFRQQRESLYGRQNLKTQVDNLFREFAQHDRGQASYELAADVQRPRADLRGRYKDHHAEALALLRQGGILGGSSVPQASGTRASSSQTVFNPTATQTVDTAGFEQAQRRQKVAALLQHAGRGNSVLFRAGLLTTKAPDIADFTRRDVALTPQTITSSASPGAVDNQGVPSSSGVNAALSAASSYLGVRESGGNNRGREVDKLEKGFGMVGQPWCGIYVGTVLKKAGVKGVDSRVASVAEIERMARAKQGAFAGGWHSAAHARAGDALVTRQGEHVVFVTSVDKNGTIHAIGGNTGNGAVERRTYKAGEVFGAARPRYGTPKRR